MASELCMRCFHVKGKYDVCPMCGYVEGTPPEQPHYLAPGMILGNHFLVGTAIGAGGFGITYRCFDITLGVTVAVKEFYPAGLVNRAPGQSAVGLLSGDKKEKYRSRLNRFLMEAQSIAQFGNAKDIVNVYDFFEENNTAYIIMEYIDGVLLKDYLEKQGRLDVSAALSVISPIVNAVKKIHAKGIIHRDISPDNIFISGEDSVKVFDFGAAQLNASSEGQAAEKVIKVGYSAPEQYRDNSRQGFYTDIYSAGAILYQMLTGIRPAESTEREFRDDLKSPAELGIRLEPNLDRAVMEALAVKPELRFQSIQQFEDALQNKRMAEYPKVKLKKRKRRRNWIISSAATLVLGIGVFIGLMNTVFKPENVMFDTALKEEDEIVVWVDRPSAKQKLDSIVEEVYLPNEKVTTNDERLKEMREENKRKIKSVKVVDVTEDGSTMDEKLKAAKAAGKMPDMFLSDRVSDLDEYSLVSMRDTVYEAIRPDAYLYMDTYPKFCHGLKEMPTGINSLFLYSIKFKPGGKKKGEKNSLEDSSFYSDSEKTSPIELSEILSSNTDKPCQESTVMKDGYLTRTSLLASPDCFMPEQGRLMPDTGMVNNLIHFIDDIRANRGLKDEGSVSGNSIIGGVEERKEMEKLRSKGTESGKKPNQVEDYSVRLVTQGGKMLVSYEDKFAISAESSRNRQIACMRLLWVCLLSPSQVKHHPADGVAPFPILKSEFDKFFEYNPKFICFQKQIGSPALLIGDGQAEIAAFDTGLRAYLSEKGILEKNIEDFCVKYATEEKKKMESKQKKG